jgi:hypothetical protein
MQNGLFFITCKIYPKICAIGNYQNALPSSKGILAGAQRFERLALYLFFFVFLI